VRTTVRADLLAGMLVEVTVIAKKSAQKVHREELTEGNDHDR
jgi:hypothetical protein